MPGGDELTPRIGVVGCGAVTERYHLPALLATPDVRLTALVDPMVERARTLAAAAGAPLALSNHRELSGKVDIAIVAVPNAYHEQVAVDLLDAGIHVLVEKPMARSTVECDRMLAAASTTGAVLAVGHDFRHYPVAKFARDLFAGGMLGGVRRVSIQQSTGTRWPAVSTAALSSAAGGGVLLDFGVHILDLLLWWLGDLRPVAYRDNAVGGVEAECACEFALDSGAPVHMELSRTRAMCDTVIVECDRGTVELGIFDPAVVRLSLPGDHPPLLGNIPDQEFDEAPLRTVFARQLEDFIAAIKEGRVPLVSGADGRRVVGLIEACYALRQPLRLPWDYPESYTSIGRTGP